MRRTALAVAALLFAAPSADAAGAFVTRQVQDGTGTRITQFYDMSGTGVGPYLQVFVCSDGAGNVCPTGGGGGGGGTVTQGPAGTAPWLVTDTAAEQGIGTPADTAATVGGNGSSIAQLKQAVAQLSSAVTQLTAIVSNQNATNAGTSATKAQGIQGATGGVPVAVSWTGQTVGLTGSLPAGTNTIGAVNQAGAWTVSLGAGSNAIGSIANTSFASTIADGADVTLGAKADAAYAGSGSASVVAALKGVYSIVSGPTPSGTNVIGKFGIDQTTNGTSNGVYVVNPGLQIGYYSPTLVTVSTTGYSAAVIDRRAQAKISETGSDDPLVGILPTTAFGATSLVVNASDTGVQGKNLYYASAGNATSTAGYVIEYDATTAPSTGTLTNSLIRGCHVLPASGVWEPSRSPGPPKKFANGVVLLVSSTPCFGSTVTYTTGTVTAYLEGEAR